MIKKLLIAVFVFTLTSCVTQKSVSQSEINETVDSWHLAASQANFDSYFNLMTSDAIFIGTDATENWKLQEFKEFSKPFFDKGKAWSFTTLERNVYSTNGIVYFDELLDTQMGICRGSGVLKMENGSYKIAHYVLSIAVPNEHVTSLTALKKKWDEEFMDGYKLKM
ncbi:MAG: nuclear transport factor 2 family protein [Nonlabens sp.]|nr:nuclear transport factor 2 family protein [Nonlabens sp.]